MPTVLYLAHGFPPASGSGSIRALAFARYLPMFGWRPVVLTPGQRWAINPDRRLLGAVPDWLEVIRTRSLEPTPAQTASSSVPPRLSVVSPLRRHLGHARRLPDAHLGWLPFAVAAGLRRARRVDLLYSSSGPFTSHLVGLVLHRLTGRPWVAELRDGWFLWNRAILPDYPAWRAPIEARLESAVIREASRVVCVTQRMAHAFRDQYPDLPARRFAVVPNGFDPAQIGRPGPHKTEHFEVLHAGALYYGRPIGPFLLAAGRLASEDSGFAHRFRLRLVGSLDATASAEVACSPVAERVTFGGFLDHAATLEAERAADLLLLVANTTPGAEATVPGKLFEYLATGRPVLAIAPARSATAEVLERTGGGWLADASDPHAIYRQLSAAFQAHQSGAVCAANPAELAHFDRRRLAATLARVFDEVS